MTKKKMMRSERELILADALLCPILEEQARKIGVSIEEYVDRFLEVFYKKPNILPVLKP